jgi:polyisoprenyl-phosphate glycosyltransferase
MMNGSKMRDNELTILMPIYNDWDALSLLLPILDRELKADGLTAGILIVDDGSTEAGPENFGARFESIKTVDVLSLRRNLGHQRAIAVGLSYIEANQPQCSVVIMDSDGEDDPKDVPRLVRECVANRGEKIVFAARIRRSEGWWFTFFYHMYRLIHFLLTGVHVRVGNFSIVPPNALKRLVAVSELWNHYAAAVHKAKLPIGLIPSERGTRLEGSPRMDMVSLIVHGLSAMAVFGDRIGVRLLIVVSAGTVLTVTALVIVIAIRVGTDLAVPGWATYATGLLLVILTQMLLVIVVFVFVILAARNAANVLPTRDYVHIMGGRQRIYG